MVHFGDGCNHSRIAFDLKTRRGVKGFRSFMLDAADLVVSYGGSLSGEHGDGQARAELLPRMFGNKLVHAFGEFKPIWDPSGKMNPNKIVAPQRLDQNLRERGFRRRVDVSDRLMARVSRPLASAVIAVFILGCLLVLPQRAGRHPGTAGTA